MTLEINGKTYENISKVEIEGVYETAPEEGLVIHLDLYCSCGGYISTVDIRDFEHVKGLIKEAKQ